MSMPLPKPRVAVIGTGNMGSAAARRLHSLGFNVVVWNRTREKAASLAEELGLEAPDTLENAIGTVEIALLFLSDDQALFQVLSRFGRIDGLTVVNMGTHTPAAAEHARAYVEGNGGCYVESPVVGGPGSLLSGKAILIVAGRPACVNTARPVLEALSGEQLYLGETPSKAQALKLAFNTLLIDTVSALSESLRLAEAYGVEVGVFKSLLSKTVFAGIVEKYVDRMRRDPSEPASFRLELAAKDLHYALDAGFHVSEPMETTGCTARKYVDAVLQGLGSADYTRIYWKSRRARQE
ncbi:MAG: NAD(P)-dependent oxidoreductase [Desulfurococcales archaeon]|nr:NAD(P)-dependent oxidoreductase [Desulfurococcales archaeon]